MHIGHSLWFEPIFGKEKWEATKEKDEWEGSASKEDQEGEWEDSSYWEGSYHKEWADDGEWEVDEGDAWAWSLPDGVEKCELELHQLGDAEQVQLELNLQKKIQAEQSLAAQETTNKVRL